MTETALMAPIHSPTYAEQLLEELIRIPSLSGAEHAASRWLVEQMQALGLRAHVDAAGNAVGETGTSGPETVLLGHIDTVPGQIEVRRENGRLYGRGAVDAKGPLATFVLAAARAASQPDFGGRIVVVGCVEEEAPSSKGAHYAVDRYRPDVCIVGEPSGWDRITIGYKGTLRLSCRAEVACGHSAHERRTAPERMVAWWQQLQAFAAERNAGREAAFDQLQPALLALNSASDGIAEHATAEIGIRLPLAVDPDELVAELHGWSADIAVTVLGATPAFQAERTSSAVRALSRALRSQNVQPRLVRKTGTADMNIVGPAWGCPTVAYGPGDAALDHTPDEHIVLEDYHRAIDVLATALVDLSRGR